MKLTLGQINDVMVAAQLLEVIDCGPGALQSRVAQMPTAELLKITNAITILRRVSREWQHVELELKTGDQ